MELAQTLAQGKMNTIIMECEPLTEGRTMKTRVVVRDRITGLYLRCLGNWTRGEIEACSFSSTANALLFCLQNQLLTAQLVLKFGDERYDLEFAIPDHQSFPSRRDTMRK
jgi:hypothetical protein